MTRGGARELRRSDLAGDPLQQFESWFREARERSGLVHPEAACLSTLGVDGYPQGRIVLLKGVDPRGFTFYTNLESAKALAIAAHPRAALTFHWEGLERQVRVAGDVERVDDAEADAYFASRPRGSQIGAWASRQSAPLEGRAGLEARAREVEERFAGASIPRPEFWGGYRLRPRTLEFWQGRQNRLHDRFRYTLTPGGWEITRLHP